MADIPSNQPGQNTAVEEGKGKAKTAAEDVSMEEDDDESEESGVEAEVEEPEEDDEDNMEEIDTENIIRDGRRTRGKTIDFATAAQNTEGLEDDEDEDDDDFEEPNDDAMEH